MLSRNSNKAASLGIRLVLVLSACALEIASVAGQTKPGTKNSKKSVLLTGRVLANVDYTTGFLRGSLGDRFSVFVFGAERTGAPVTPVKVMFKFYESESPLPSSFLNHSLRYELQLMRESSCDETVQRLSYERNVDETGKALPPTKVLRLLEGVPKDALGPDGTVLACYVLRPGKYKALNQQPDPEAGGNPRPTETNQEEPCLRHRDAL